MAGRKEYEMLFKLSAVIGSTFNGTFSSAILKNKELQKTISGINKVTGNISGYSKLDAALQKSKDSLAGLNEEHTLLSEKMAAAKAPSETLRKDFKKNEKNIANVTEKIKKQETSLGRLGEELNKTGIDTNNLVAENDKLKQAYERVRQAQENYGNISALQNENRQKIAATRQELLRTVGVMAGLGAAFYAGPIKGAMGFEGAMADVAKVVDGLRDGSTGKLTQDYYLMKKELLELSTVIPMTGKQLTEIAAAAGQAGIARSEIIGFSTDAAKMGIAFDSTAEQAGEWMAKWRTSFKLTQPQVVELSDKINYLGNTSAAKAEQISEIVTKVGPLGEVAGFATGEVAALGTTLVSVGVSEDVAATGVKKLMTTMTAGSAATKRQQTALKLLNVDAKELAQRMQEDATGAVLDFMEAVNQLPKAEQTSVLKSYFGEEAVASLAPMLTNLDLLKENFIKVGDASQYAGSMEKEYAARADTTENKVELMKNQLMASAITLGEVFLPVVTEAVAKVAELGKQFATWTAANPETVKSIVKVTTTFLALRAGFKLGQLTFFKLKGGVLAVRKAMAHFSTTTAVASANAVKGMAGMAKATGGLSGALGMIPLPAKIGLAAVAALTIGFVAYKVAKNKARQATLNFSDDLAASAEKFDVINDKVNGTKLLTDEYKKLELRLKDTSLSAEAVADAKERMKEIEDLLILQNPEVLSRLDQENGKMSESVGYIDEKLDKQRELAKMQLEQAQYEAQKELPENIAEIKRLSGENKSLEKDYEMQTGAQKNLDDVFLNWQLFENSKHTQDEYDTERVLVLERANAILEDIGDNRAFEYVKEIEERGDEYGEAAGKTIKTIEANNTDLATATASLQEYYDTSMKLISLDMGASFEDKISELDSLKTQLVTQEVGGNDESGARAQKTKDEISVIETGLLTAAAKARDLGLEVEHVPEIKIINIEETFAAVDGLIEKLSEVPVSITTQINVQQTQASTPLPQKSSGGKVPGYATGGFIMKPTLATFAENGPEAAIPLDGSANAKNLWTKTGQMLGMFSQTKETNYEGLTQNLKTSDVGAPNISAPTLNMGGANSKAPTITLNFENNPVLQVRGNAPNDLTKVLEENNASIINKIMEMLAQLEDDKMRLAYE